MIYLIQSEKLAKLGVSTIWCINLYIYIERERDIDKDTLLLLDIGRDYVHIMSFS